MAWRKSTYDPVTDPAAAAVRAAFETARAAGRPAGACYRAAVAAWRRAHPEHAPAFAAKQAVAIVLTTEAQRHFATIDNDQASVSLRPMDAPPPLTPAKRADRARREARLAAALRENLRRRKTQARTQQEAGAEPPAAAGSSAAEPAPARPRKPPA